MTDDSPIFGGTPAQQDAQLRVYRQYVGALALLGRLARYDRLGPDDRASLDRAFADANEVLVLRAAPVRFRRASPGCYGSFVELS